MEVTLSIVKFNFSVKNSLAIYCNLFYNKKDGVKQQETGVRKTNSHKKEGYKKMSSKDKKKGKLILIFCIFILALLIIALVITYFAGRSKYKGKFLPNTFINEVDVGGKSPAEVNKLFSGKDTRDLTILRRDGETITIPFSDFEYTHNIDSEIKKLYEEQNPNTWLDSLFNDTKYTLKYDTTYDEVKLGNLLPNADWGSSNSQNATIQLKDGVYEIVPEVQGDEVDFNVLEQYIISCVDNKTFEINATDSGCYVPPQITSEDLKGKQELLTKLSEIKINYNFDYTTETLSGQELMDLVTVNEGLAIEVNKEKVEAYVKKLAGKYDTYKKERSFKATIQGDIIIPVGSDARYGWWLDKDKMSEQLTELLKSAESHELVEPIYYSENSYSYIGLKSARSENDDIGNTYVEIDLTNQKLWYYEAGELKLECFIVSGKLTPARTTEAGVYRLWYKDKNHRMKATNSAGESWDSTCSYWSSVSPVGIGLHDAQFRSSFGGTIYKQNGSHGCINMSLSTGKFIYDNVDFNTPVVMYY